MHRGRRLNKSGEAPLLPATEWKASRPRAFRTRDRGPDGVPPLQQESRPSHSWFPMREPSDPEAFRRRCGARAVRPRKQPAAKIEISRCERESSLESVSAKRPAYLIPPQTPAMALDARRKGRGKRKAVISGG